MEVSASQPAKGGKGSRRGLAVGVVVVLAIVVVGLIGFGVWHSYENRLINETASISESIREQGVTYHSSNGGVIRRDGIIIGVQDARRDRELGPVAQISLYPETDETIGTYKVLSLGESLTVPGVGTVYLAGFSSFQNTQQASVLFVPES